MVQAGVRFPRVAFPHSVWGETKGQTDMTTAIIDRTNERLAAADAFIDKAYDKRAWPIRVDKAEIITRPSVEVREVDGQRVEVPLPSIHVPRQATVATYLDGSRQAHGVVGRKYHAMSPKSWADTIRAVCLTGAIPYDCRIFGGGSSVFAGFKVAGDDEFRSYFYLLDDLSGMRSMRYFATLFRVECTNQQAQFSPYATSIRHTASIHDRMEQLRETIDDALIVTKTARDVYAGARRMSIERPDVEAILDHLFPWPKEDKENGKEVTQRMIDNVQRRREDVAGSMANAVNVAGKTLATVWNGLTHSVDFHPGGGFRHIRQSASYPKSKIECHLTGGRGEKVQAYYKVINEIVRMGNVRNGIEAVAA